MHIPFLTDQCRQQQNADQPACADPESFDRVGKGFLSFFMKGERERNQKPIIGPPAKRLLTIIYMAFRWRAGDGSTLKDGLVAL